MRLTTAALIAAAAATTFTATPARAALDLEWSMGVYGAGIGLAGLITHDLDGNGKAEIIAGGGSYGFGANARWYVISEMPTGGYAQVYISPLYDESVAALALADLDLDARPEIYVGISDGTVIVYDSVTFLERARFSRGTDLTHLAIAGGELYALGESGTSIYQYDGSSYTLATSIQNGGARIAVGNVDTDSALELVIVERFGGGGVVVDRDTRAIQWTRMEGFGALVELADLDEDGMEEIVAAERWSVIRIFDADLQTEKFTLPTDLDIGSLYLYDVTGDTLPEIIYGDNQWGEVHVVSVATQQDLYSVGNPEHGTTDVVIGDVGGDSAPELLWGAGASSTGPDHLFIADTTTHQIIWQNLDLVGPLSAVDIADIDGDGANEIMMVSWESNSSYDDGVVHVFDGKTHALEYFSTDLPNVLAWGGVRSLKVVEADGDAGLEYVLSVGHLYEGVIQVYDASTHQLERETPEYEDPTNTFDVADLDDDGQPEIVVASAGPFHLRVLEGATLGLEWEAREMNGPPIYAVKIENIDSDPGLEIILTTGNRLVVYDAATAQKQRELATSAHGLAITETEIVVGTDNGEIAFHDPETLQRLRAFSIGTGRIAAVRVVELVGGEGPVIVAAGDEIFAVASLDGVVSWSRDDLDQALGERNHLAIGEVDDDSSLEVIVGGNFSLYQFEAGRGEVCDGSDNDGDGEIDEMLVRPCSTACGDGTERCLGGDWVECSARFPGPEMCDGADNDCDGMTDEDRVCAMCIDDDGDGYGMDCTAGPDCNDRQPAINPGENESGEIPCSDLRDNDCDGLVDSQEPACRACNTDAECATDVECKVGKCASNGMCTSEQIPGCMPTSPTLPGRSTERGCDCTSVQASESGLGGLLMLLCFAGLARGRLSRLRTSGYLRRARS